MGKILEEDAIKGDINSEGEIPDISLPMILPRHEKLYKMFSGKFIGIVEGKIIAFDASLRKLQKKVRDIIPEGKDCTVEYFEDEVSIYGSCF